MFLPQVIAGPRIEKGRYVQGCAFSKHSSRASPILLHVARAAVKIAYDFSKFGSPLAHAPPMALPRPRQIGVIRCRIYRAGRRTNAKFDEALELVPLPARLPCRRQHSSPLREFAPSEPERGSTATGPRCCGVASSLALSCCRRDGQRAETRRSVRPKICAVISRLDFELSPPQRLPPADNRRH